MTSFLGGNGLKVELFRVLTSLYKNIIRSKGLAVQLEGVKAEVCGSVGVPAVVPRQGWTTST